MNPRIVMALPLVCLCALFNGVAPAHAKPVDPKEGPPVLQPVELKVEGRLPVRIVLKASGIRLSPVKFVIRKAPEFGSVRLLKQTAGDSVEVEYVPPVDISIREDFFWFACSNAKGFSSDTRAHIQIRDIGPRLKVTLSLDFPSTRVGQTASLPLELSNSGDQPAAGKLSVAPPWELEQGGDSYALAPGERKVIGVVFKPSKAGWSQTEIQISGDAPATVQVRGEALDWVEVAKDPVSLVWSGEGEQRAELLLSHSGGKPLELTIQASPPLAHESRIRIEAGTVRAVPIRWAGGLVPGGWGTLLVSSEGGMRRVVVWNLDAVLSGLGPSFLLEGEGTASHARRTFTNIGGRSGTWTFRCTPPFHLSDAEAPAKWEPASSPEPVAPPAPVVPQKKTGDRAAIPGFVWDPEQNRYVPMRGAPAPTAEQPVQPRKTTPVTPQPSEPKQAPQPQYPVELTRRLQPGESFVLQVGLSGRPPALGGTLFVSGPGLRHEEALYARDVTPRERGRLTNLANLPNLPVAEKKPAAMPSDFGQGLATLPPPSLPPTARPAGPPGSAALPNLTPPNPATPKHAAFPPLGNLVNAFFPIVVFPGFRLKDVSSDAATIVFPAPPEVTPEHLVVRYGNLSFGSEGDPVVEWIPFENANRRGKRVGGNIEIRLRGLTAGCANHIDLLTPIGADGKRDRFCAVEIVTPAASSLYSALRIWVWVAAATSLGMIYVLRRGLIRSRKRRH
jgi:hypothetical protein